ncbi:MAG: hypothetical protein CVU89_12540 [Firmicutes bacterium HGW-Firmicutes-14]|nr:MAG: hypothetical protein CVU89_12540 [Firmicutes bacterium HGW-Firmicutes-14]
MVFKGKGTAALVLAGLLIFLLAAGAAAEPEEKKEEPVTVKVESAYGYHAKQGAWVPLRIEVANKGPDIRGKLRVVYGNREQYLVDYITEAVVAKGTTKKFNLDIPVNDYMGSLKVELVSGSKVLASGRINMNFHRTDQPIVGILDRPFDEFRALAGIRLPNGTSPTMVTLKKEDFPEKGEMLSFFDVLVINDINPELNKEQGEALLHWVNRGGILVIGGGAGWHKVLPNLPEELRAAEVSTVDTRNLGGLAGLPGQTAGPAGDVRVALVSKAYGSSLYTQAGIPLVVEKVLGSGKVDFLAFDPAMEPMAGWSGTGVLLQDLLFTGNTSLKLLSSPGSAVFKGMPGSRNPWALTEALNTIPAMKLPSLKGIAAILGVYILVVGVISYLVLKKFDKREWAWFAAPALAVLFVAVIYTASFRERLSDVVTHQINVVDVNPNNTLAQVTTTTGVFAPSQNRYEIELEGRHMVNALPTFGDVRSYVPGQHQEARIIVEEGQGRTRIELLDMQAWLMRGFTTLGETSLKGTITGELTVKDKKKWVAVIQNNTEYEFTDGLVLSSFGYKKTGVLKPGDRMEIEIPVNSGTGLGGPPLYYQAYNPGFNWQGVGRPPRPNQKDMLRNQVLEAVMNYEGGPNTGNQPLFLAWSEQPVQGALKLPDRSAKQFFTTLFKVSLTLKIDKDNMNIPPGIINGILTDSNNIGFGPPGVIFMQPNSEAFYQIDIPEGKFDKLNLHLMAQGGNPGLWETALYNWKTKAWDEVKFKTGDIEIKDRDLYVNQNRQVRFRLKVNQGGFEVQGVSISTSSEGGGGQ